MSLTYQELDTHFDRDPETRILCLLKVGAKDHLEELRAGRLRFRRLSYYRDIEQKAEVHFDANEGVVSVLQADRIKLMFKAADKTIEVNAQTGLVGQVVVRANDDRPVFCFHTLHTGDWTKREFGKDELPEFVRYVQIPELMANFGTHCWLLTNGEEFFARLRAAVRREHLGFQATLVRYVDFKRVHGRIPKRLHAFVKSSDYEREREFRIQLDATGPLLDPFILNVGDLSDISVVVPLGEVRENMTFSFPDGSTP